MTGPKTEKTVLDATTNAPDQADVDALRDLLDLMADFPDNDQRARYLLTCNWMRDRQTTVDTTPAQHGVAWEDRLNIICLCGKVCSAVIKKNPAGGFMGRPGSATCVDSPAAQAFANHLWEMNHPANPPGAES
ncbi:hypothetical protein [Nocardioides sp.]|uniref:hypothetical protein n=1 Tax=Nocardioides sp. TaxID=35761 RepID=UPI00356A35C9